MQCPICQVDLLMMDRQGIEIDYCPKCRGVWLDRGELEKLVALADSPTRQGKYRDDEDDDDDDDDDRHRRDSYREREPHSARDGRYERREEYPSKGRKKEGFFGSLFDLFD